MEQVCLAEFWEAFFLYGLIELSLNLDEKLCLNFINASFEKYPGINDRLG